MRSAFRAALAAMLWSVSKSMEPCVAQRTVTMDVFETISGQCVPLPAAVFAYEGDTQWGALGRAGAAAAAASRLPAPPARPHRPT